MAKIPEYSSDILVDRITGAMKRYQKVVPADMTDIVRLGRFLGDWRADVGVYKMDEQRRVNNGVISAQVVYAREESPNNAPRLVFRARSQEVPRELLVRGEHDGLLEALAENGPEYRRGLKTYFPLVAVALVRGYDRPAYNRSKAIASNDDARIRLELHREYGQDLSVVTRGHVGTDNTIIPDRVLRVIREPATSIDFVKIYSEIFGLVDEE